MKKILLIVAGLLVVIAGGIMFFGLTSSSIQGTVVDELTGKPIKAALVKTSGKAIQSTSRGKFVYKGRPGKIKLVIFKKGFGKYERKVDVPFLVGKDIGRIGLKNGIITGSVSEDAVAPQEVTTSTVSIAGKKVIAAKGNFTLKGIPIGSQTLKVESPNHETYEKKINIHTGLNKPSILLALTPDETVRREFRAQQFKDFELLYQYVHPDVQAVYPKDKFIKVLTDYYQANPIELASYSTGQVTILPSWTEPEINKTYQNVAELEITETYKATTLVGVNAERTSHQKMHVAKVGNQWKFFPYLNR